MQDALCLVAYIEFIKGGETAFDKSKSCDKAESQTEFLVGVRMVFLRESQVLVRAGFRQ